MNINTIIIGGNMARDPEVRVTPKGTAVAQFAIANNRKYKDDSGAQREEVSFVDCEAWGKTAENIGKWFSKGNPICVQGRIKQDSWEDKETKQKRTKLKIVVDQFHFVGGKREDAPQSAQESRREVPAPQHAKPTNTDEEVPW